MPRSIVALALALSVAACTASPEPAGPAPIHGATDGDEVTVEGIRAHLEALQRIADQNGGTRVVGSAGYEASVDYVVDVLGDAGYEVETITVDVPAFEQRAPTVLERVSPSPETWTDDVDLRAMVFSGSGDVRARVTRADGGCEASELAGFPAGDVALLEPGPCLRRDQVLNAQDAGASALIFPYADTTAGRPLRPTLLYPDGIDVPVLAVTPDVGQALTPTSRRSPTVRIGVDASSTWIQVESVVAETAGGASDRVVMLGAHLDSVMDGPGVNDNGSGVAMLLEIARWLASRDAEATVRFAFWAGEEEGLYGSRDYAAGLSEEEVDTIAAYLNLDMVASPNFVRYVIADAQTDADAAEGDERIRTLFTGYFEDLGLEVESVETYGGADHGAFARAGIPVGGLFAGTVEEKTDEQAERYGGEVGEPLDGCYHQACDTLENVSDVALEQFAAAYVAVLTELAAVR
ncbi:MAG TPA: M20/M25/M40 family metallo-hydrolase [Actinomycetota bacterium]|nr:M20/M25/M40 family metallo-hydrolase [Actinomycetota bacterium]